MQLRLVTPAELAARKAPPPPPIVTLSTSIDARVMTQYLIDHAREILTLAELPSAERTEQFVELARWIRIQSIGGLVKRPRPAPPLSVLRLYIEALCEARELRLPIYAAPIPVPSVRKALDEAHESRGLASLPLGMRTRCYLTRGAAGVWSVASRSGTRPGTHYGRIERDGVYYLDNLRPESIEQQFAHRAIRAAIAEQERRICARNRDSEDDYDEDED